MTAITNQKNIDSSPRKLRLVADMVRKMSPERAIEVLRFTPNAAAKPLSEAIKTALANGQGQTGLVFKKLEINEGLKMKRMRVGTAGRGRSRAYRRRFSHIKVELGEPEVKAPIVQKNKALPKVVEVQEKGAK